MPRPNVVILLGDNGPTSIDWVEPKPQNRKIIGTAIDGTVATATRGEISVSSQDHS